MSFIKVNSVSKEFNGVAALKSITSLIKEGENVAIVGETGSGKSTLLRIIGGLEDADKGEVFYQDNRVVGPSGKLIPGHSDIIYLSQHFVLPKFITVRAHLDNPYLIASEDAEMIYQSCRIQHLLSKDTRELSGGEKQRVALAKALTNMPEVLLLDEPFSNLDFIHKQTIKEVLDDIKKNWNTTIIMVSHEPRDVLPWADTILVMQKGEILQSDIPTTIYKEPINEYVAGLFGKYNLIDPKEWGIETFAKKPASDDKTIVRPEEFQVSLNENKGVLAKVLSVKYHGNYDEITVKTTFQELIIETATQLYKINSKVFIHL